MKIKPLSELTFGQRFLLTLIIVLVILFAMAAFGYFSGGWDKAEGQAITDPPELYKDIPLDAKLILLDRRALDEAYHQHLIRLWNVWLSDGARQSQNITNGLAIARRSYNYAATEISRRESTILEQDLKK